MSDIFQYIIQYVIISIISPVRDRYVALLSFVCLIL